jgi:DNA-binding MarR family transcriptional regulator
MAKQKINVDPVETLERLTRLIRAEEHTGDLNPAQWSALRYLARCNRFSNSPGALTRYLGATKGTISQTLMALERKGLISKAARPEEARSIALVLTEAGEKRLQDDPWTAMRELIDRRGNKVRKKLAGAGDELLSALLSERHLPTFGSCSSCRYFRENGAPAGVKGKHWCLSFEQPLTRSDADRICASHDPA